MEVDTAATGCDSGMMEIVRSKQDQPDSQDQPDGGGRHPNIYADVLLAFPTLRG